MKVASLGLPLLKMMIRYEPDVVSARQQARRLAQLLGFDNQDQARIATAVSELARNVFQYAGLGSIECFFSDLVPQTLYVKVSDNGPGISQLEEVLSGVYISKSGMGVGLIGSKKLMDAFEVNTSLGQGTTVTIGKVLDRHARKVSKDILSSVIDQLISKPSATPLEEIQYQNRDLLRALDEAEKTKRELNALNQELAETNRGVVALYAELDEKAVSLRRANEVKTSFLSNMTHEFRTPLSSVISLTRLLLARTDGELSEEQEKQVLYIQKSSEDLLDLVNNLLDLAKVEAGKISVNPAAFQIEEMLSGLRGMFRPIVTQSPDISLEINLIRDERELITDQAKLSQILRNLVSNAIKYTEKGRVSVSTTFLDNDRIRFAVQDTGIGIAPEYFEAIFEDFSQIDSKAQQKYKGTGLGLPLSKKLARMLGGNLWVESAIGKGSVFYVEIPRIYLGSADAILISSEADVFQEVEPEARFRVLIIDEDESSRLLLKGMIAAEMDVHFYEASDGKSGFENAQNLRPDIIFMDLSMADGDGLSLIARLKSKPFTQPIPIVVHTALNLRGEERELMKHGIVAVLSKTTDSQAQKVEDLRHALCKAGFDYKQK